MIPYMIGKIAPNSSHLTRGLVKCVPSRDYFRAVPSENGDKFVTSPPLPIVERVDSLQRHGATVPSDNLLHLLGRHSD